MNAPLRVAHKDDAWARFVAPVRILLVLLLAAALGGCLSGGDTAPRRDPVRALDICRDGPLVESTWYFGPGHTLGRNESAAGAEPGNAFSSGFLTNDLKEWLSPPVSDGLWIHGDVTLEYWVRSTGSPAPLAIGGDPGEGYHFFNQFGSDRSLQPAYATEYSTIAPVPGAVDHYVENLTMPPGGFVVEAGDRLRVLLTDLALDGPTGSGHEILYGSDTPSQIRFTARCFPKYTWPESTVLLDELVTLPGNQGLLTGAVPATDGLNQATYDLFLPAGTQRLTVTIQQTSDANPVKDDIDIVLLEVDGSNEWGIGSPYSDEQGTLWADNLANVFPRGMLQVQVNSYSGFGYQGRLLVTAQNPVLA